MKYIKRTYRITKEQDKIVKDSAKFNKMSESSIIRTIIEVTNAYTKIAKKKRLENRNK